MRSLAHTAVVDYAWVVVGSFDGRIEVWRGGVFEDEHDATEAFNAHAEEQLRYGEEIKFLHAVRIEIDREGLPGVRAPQVRDLMPPPNTDTGFYAIASIDNPSDRWSNADGWTDGPGFTVFTAEECRAQPAPPMGGKWVRIETARA